MKIINYIIILLLFISCNTLIKDKATSALPYDKLQTEIENEKSQINDDFFKKIKKLSIEKFPFDFIDCDTNTLKELEKTGNLETILNIQIDSLISLNSENDALFYPISIKKIHNSTSSFSPKYYYFLLDNKEDKTSVSFSNSYVLKRLKPLNEIEVLVLITKIYDVKLDETRVIGSQLDLLTYNIQQKKSIDRKRLITVGIGLEDIAYYECFNMSSDYEIQTKSFMHLEDESTTIKRNLKINTTGKITSLKPEVTIYE